MARKRPDNPDRPTFEPPEDVKQYDSFFTIHVRGNDRQRRWYIETFWATRDGTTGFERSYGDSLGALLLKVAADVAILREPKS